MGTDSHLTVFTTTFYTVWEALLNRDMGSALMQSNTMAKKKNQKKKGNYSNTVEGDKAKLKNNTRISYFDYHGQRWPFSGGNI